MRSFVVGMVSTSFVTFSLAGLSQRRNQTPLVSAFKEKTEKADDNSPVTLKWWEKTENQTQFKDIIWKNFVSNNSEELDKSSGKPIFCYESDNGNKKFTQPDSSNLENPCPESFQVKFNKLPNRDVFSLVVYDDSMEQVGGVAADLVGKPNSIRVTNVQVDEDLRGKGIGTVIVSAAFLVAEKIYGKKNVVIGSNISMDNWWDDEIGLTIEKNGYKLTQEQCAGYMSGTKAYLAAIGFAGYTHYCTWDNKAESIQSGMKGIIRDIEECAKNTKNNNVADFDKRYNHQDITGLAHAAVA